MSDCCLIKKVATVEVYENKNEVRAYGFMAGDRNTPIMEVKFRHLWGEENLSTCKLRWIIVDDLGSLLVGEVPIEQDNTASIQLPNELFNGERRMKVQLTVASCDGSRILNLQQFTDLKVINNLATNEVVEPVYQMLINQVYDDTKKYLAELETSYKAKYGSLESVYAKSKASLEQYLITAENGGNAEFLQGYNPKNFNRVENTINELVNSASSKYKVGDVVEVLGYYTAGDGAHHKRKIESADDGSGVQLVNGLWANIVHNGEVNVSWFGAKGDGVTDDTSLLQKALDFVVTSKAVVVLEEGKTYCTTDVLYLWSNQKGVSGWGDEGTTLKTKGGYATLRKTTNKKTMDCYESYLNNIDSVIAFRSNDKIRNWGMCLKLENIIFENTNATSNSWAIARAGGGLDTIKNLYFKGVAGFWCPERWFHNRMNMIRGNDRIVVIGQAGTSNNLDTILSHGNTTEYPTLSLRGDKSTLSNCCLETQKGKAIEFAFSSWELSGIDIEPSPKVEVPTITATNSSIKINQIQIPHPTVNNVSLFGGVGSVISVDNIRLVVSSDATIENTYLMESSDLSIQVNTIYFEAHENSASAETLTALKNNFKLSSVYNNKNFVSVGNVVANSTSQPFSKVVVDADNRAYIGNDICGFGRIFRGLIHPQTANDGTSVKWARGYTKDDIIFTTETNANGILGYVASNSSKDVNGNTYNTIPLVIKSSFAPTSAKTGSLWIKNADNSLHFFDGVLWQKISSSAISAATLNTPYHATKMQQQGIYEDFVSYMDSQHEYDKEQKALESAKQEAYQLALAENSELAYEDWLASYPELMPVHQEPVPSERLMEFYNEYK